MAQLASHTVAGIKCPRVSENRSEETSSGRMRLSFPGCRCVRHVNAFFFFFLFFFLDVGVETTLLELRSCVKVEVAVLGSPSLIVRTVSVDVKQC